MKSHPDPLIQFLVALETQTCLDCGGLTAEAARYGMRGRFCSCPFDREHA